MNEHDPVDQLLTRALESAPQVTIPDDFALRVLAHLPAHQSVSFALPDYLPAAPSLGRRVAFVAVSILFVAMLTVAVSTTQLPRLLIECICATEFVLLTVWLTLHPDRFSL
jgi:hypothetical protein